jgi:hypothetical protein
MVSESKLKLRNIQWKSIQFWAPITIKKYPILLLFYHHMKPLLLNSNAFPVSLWLILKLKLKLVNANCCERICLGPCKHQTSSHSQSGLQWTDNELSPSFHKSSLPVRHTKRHLYPISSRIRVWAMSEYNTTYSETQQIQYSNFAVRLEIASTHKFMYCRHMTAITQHDVPTDWLQYRGGLYSVCKQKSGRESSVETGISWMKKLQWLGRIKTVDVIKWHGRRLEL